MRINHEELILHNPTLGACAFWHMSRAFSLHGAGRSPELPYFFVTSAMIFHRSTVDKIRRMNFDSGFLKAVTERPDIVSGLQFRMENFSKVSLESLQLGVDSGIILREGGGGFPTFRALGTNLPRAIRVPDASVVDLLSAAKRLGAWFSAENFGTVQNLIAVEF